MPPCFVNLRLSLGWPTVGPAVNAAAGTRLWLLMAVAGVAVAVGAIGWWLA